MKKRLALAWIVLALTVCAAAFVRPGSYITLDAYQRIEVGMTHQQVEEVLGGPPRDESAYTTTLTHFCKWPGRRLDWWGPDIAIYITFDDQAKVCDKKFMAHDFGPAKTPSVWDAARSWLPW
jgi:hypothetical protein